MSSTIHQEVVFNASPKRVYDTLTNAEQFSLATGGAPTEISQDAGGSFSCFGGMIVGRNIELVSNQRIVQAWRPSTWEAGVYSIVKFELQEHGSQTKLIFDHTGFPEGQTEHLLKGWNDHYWKSLEKFFA